MNKFSSFFKKLKSIKHIEIILAVLLGIIVLLVYFSSTSSTDSKMSSISTSSNLYLAEVEQKLENVLEKIDGAGDVSVMLMSGSEEEAKQPTIISALVVATGAENVAVKLSIIRSLQTLLKLPTSAIEVLSAAT